MYENQIQALGYFKDWSNYLLVTTVAALGWVAAYPNSFVRPRMRTWCLWALGISTVLAMMTLALIPQVAETLTNEESIYEVKPTFNLIAGLFWEVSWVRLSFVCWPQHVSFMLGILLYIVGTQGERKASDT